jgi:hypothetical protein
MLNLPLEMLILVKVIKASFHNGHNLAVTLECVVLVFVRSDKCCIECIELARSGSDKVCIECIELERKWETSEYQSMFCDQRSCAYTV